MCLRISSAIGLVVLLAACGSESPPPPGDAVDCAIGAGAAFLPVCSLERVAGTDGLVLHQPEGGFRRLTIDRATGALLPSDGAEPLVMEQGPDGAHQFRLGQDRYRIPRALLAAPSP